VEQLRSFRAFSVFAPSFCPSLGVFSYAFIAQLEKSSFATGFSKTLLPAIGKNPGWTGEIAPGFCITAIIRAIAGVVRNCSGRRAQFPGPIAFLIL